MPETLDAKVITIDALNDKIKNGKPFQLINVLDPQYYTLGLITGSLKIPLAELETASAELDKTQEIVTYCADSSCNASRVAAELLAKKGFDAGADVGGIQEWAEAKLPVEAEPTPGRLDEANA